jgi:NAD(P)-dependent dehydrogenase (short-subunit alcohol dehydrogenase family)
MRVLVDEIADLTGCSSRTESIELNLSDVDSIRNCVTKFMQKSSLLDLLINNTGVVSVRGKTLPGFEMTFRNCYVSHYQQQLTRTQRLPLTAY